MTGRRSHARTRTNIEKAVAFGIILRAGIIGQDEQQVQAAREDLESLGVTSIGADRIREFGRGAEGTAADAANLCGRCGSGRAAIGPDGTVSPCVFSTWMGVGSVLDGDLASILAGEAMAEANSTIREATRTGHHGPEGKCQPKRCYPDQQPCFPARQPCQPKGDIPPACNPDDFQCRPGTPSTGCNPHR